MKWACGIFAAPRESNESLRQCLTSVVASGWEPIVSAEPNTDLSPVDGVSGVGMVIQREKKLGNFHHWHALAKSLLLAHPDADRYLTIEDDALFCPQAKEFVEHYVKPEHYDKCWSLYTANLANYRKPRPMLFRSFRRNHVGALAMAFPRDLLIAMTESPTISEWRGAHDQQRRGCEDHELKAVDTWIGNEIHRLGAEIWMFSRSLVQHYMPPSHPRNSALGHEGASGARSAYGFVGATGDPFRVYRVQR